MGSELLLLVGTLLGCLGVFWGILKFSSDRIAKQYRLLAERFDLEMSQEPPKMAGFVRPDPSLYGRYRGRELSFSAPGKGLKGTRQIETLLKLELRDRRLTAQVAPAGLLGGLRQRDTGGQVRWKSGDEAFDQAVDVRTKNGAVLAAGLKGEMLAWLAGNLKSTKAALYIGEGTIAYAKVGLVADEATRRMFEEVVEKLCDFAEAVEES